MTQMPTEFLGTDLLEEFLERANAVLVTLEDTAERELGDDLSGFKRDLHSLKGNAQAYGFEDVATLCHRLEDLLDGETGWSNALSAQTSVFLAHISIVLQRLESAL